VTIQNVLRVEQTSGECSKRSLGGRVGGESYNPQVNQTQLPG